jgi:hypothetical protein
LERLKGVEALKKAAEKQVAVLEKSQASLTEANAHLTGQLEVTVLTPLKNVSKNFQQTMQELESKKADYDEEQEKVSIQHIHKLTTVIIKVILGLKEIYIAVF